MIDLHTHTNESDGSFSPDELIGAAVAAGISTIAITDHDTFGGYSRVRETAAAGGIDLICGIEVSSRDRGQAIHLLGYFLKTEPTAEFTRWLANLLSRRKDRNARLAKRLDQLGVPVSVAEAEALGRSVTGRVHFARVMMHKGYVRSIQEAFKTCLGEGAPGYVEVDDPPAAEAIRRLRESGAVPVLAHPGRYGIQNAETEKEYLRSLVAEGLGGLEAIHTDHQQHDTERYVRLARELGVLTTGGSDFHGDAKPGVRLGYGNHGQMPIPTEWLERLRHQAS